MKSLTLISFFIVKMRRLFFSACLMGAIFIAAALSLMPFPFLNLYFFVNFYAILCFVILLYLPPRFWPYLLLSSFWLDFMLQMPFGFHGFLLALQYGLIFLKKTFFKEKAFWSQWIVFSLSYFIIYGFGSHFSFTQAILTILSYPLVFHFFVGIGPFFKSVRRYG